MSCETTASKWLIYMITITLIPSIILLFFTFINGDISIGRIIRDVIIPGIGIVTISIETAVWADYLFPSPGERINLSQSQTIEYIFLPAIVVIVMFFLGLQATYANKIFLGFNIGPISAVIFYMTAFGATMFTAKVVKCIDYSGQSRQMSRLKGTRQ